MRDQILYESLFIKHYPVTEPDDKFLYAFRIYLRAKSTAVNAECRRLRIKMVTATAKDGTVIPSKQAVYDHATEELDVASKRAEQYTALLGKLNNNEQVTAEEINAVLYDSRYKTESLRRLSGIVKREL